VLVNKAKQFSQFGASKSIVRCEANWPEPELGVALGLLHMDVRRLVPLITEEKESIPADPEYGWHLGKVSVGGGFGQPGGPLITPADGLGTARGHSSQAAAGYKNQAN
jgi:hypothetical protein